MRGIMQLKYEPESVTISEKNRALGWVEDQRLIQVMQDDGWIPKKFRITASGLSIEFTFVGSESRRFEYIIYQEGGSAETFVGCVNTDLSKKNGKLFLPLEQGLKVPTHWELTPESSPAEILILEIDDNSNITLRTAILDR